MDDTQIRCALKARGINISMLASALAVSPSTVSQVIRRRTTSRRIARGVARAIGKPVTTVFPDRPDYASDRGQRIERLRRRLHAASD